MREQIHFLFCWLQNECEGNCGQLGRFSPAEYYDDWKIISICVIILLKCCFVLISKLCWWFVSTIRSTKRGCDLQWWSPTSVSAGNCRLYPTRNLRVALAWFFLWLWLCSGACCCDQGRQPVETEYFWPESSTEAPRSETTQLNHPASPHSAVQLAQHTSHRQTERTLVCPLKGPESLACLQNGLRVPSTLQSSSEGTGLRGSENRIERPPGDGHTTSSSLTLSLWTQLSRLIRNFIMIRNCYITLLCDRYSSNIWFI